MNEFDDLAKRLVRGLILSLIFVVGIAAIFIDDSPIRAGLEAIIASIGQGIQFR